MTFPNASVITVRRNLYLKSATDRPPRSRYHHAVRYSSVGRSRSLFHSKDIEVLHDVTPEADRVSSRTCAIVSEPLTGFADAWQEVPEASFLTIAHGRVRREDFLPRRP